VRTWGPRHGGLDPYGNKRTQELIPQSGIGHYKSGRERTGLAKARRLHEKNPRAEEGFLTPRTPFGMTGRWWGGGVEYIFAELRRDPQEPKSTGRSACATKPKRDPRADLKIGRYKKKEGG
jgi:hypothetical protein